MAQLTAARAQCTAMRRNGEFCDGKSLPDAPFPICVEHAAKVLRYLNSCVKETGNEALAAARDFEPDLPTTPVVIPPDGTALVYYFHIGPHIKIGHTINLHTRIRFYPPDAVLLAYEFGPRKLETDRLRQFRSDLRGRNEWFEPSDKLVAHIGRLRGKLALA